MSSFATDDGPNGSTPRSTSRGGGYSSTGMRLARKTSFSKEASFGVTTRRPASLGLPFLVRVRVRVRRFRRRRNPKQGNARSAAATAPVMMTGSRHDAASSFSSSSSSRSSSFPGSGAVASGRSTSADSEDVTVTPVSGGRAMPPSAMARDKLCWNRSSVACGGSSNSFVGHAGREDVSVVGAIVVGAVVAVVLPVPPPPPSPRPRSSAASSTPAQNRNKTACS
mmetsp:Transcript_11708/g.21764  ORF Transcript_11708/g.21764 Transcript_11708/m.21764 type:complete len:224 (-) Transcript_11708:619-1290(-)